MSILVVIKEEASPSDFLARLRAEGMLVKKFDSIPRIFEILDRENADFPPNQYPEIVSIEQSNKPLKGCFTQTLNLGSRWTGANWALARHTNRVLPWARDGLRLPLATNISVSRDGTGVDIYVVDTGIEIAHPEFDGRASIVHEFASTGGIGDDNGHGTACAGCAAGSTRGFARGAQLFSVKVLDNNNTGTTGNIITGIDAAIAHYSGRASTNRPAVMSISIIGNSNSYSAAISAALDAGIVVVAAVGNDAANIDSAVDVFPAENDNVIAVGSVGPGDSPSSFTNFGTRVDLLAGGSFIDTAQLRSINPSGYSTWNGTSFSCPIVAGAIACVLQDYGRLTTREQTQIVRNYMKDQATWNQYQKVQAFEPNTPAILYLEPSNEYEPIGLPRLNIQNPPVPLTARYVRCRVLTHSFNTASASEIEFRESSGGTDITTGKAVIGNFSNGSNCFDNNIGTFGFGGTNTSVGIDMGVGNTATVSAMLWTNRDTTATENTQALRTGVIEVSNDGVTWVKSWTTWTTATWNTAAQSVEFTPAPNGLLLDLRASNPIESAGGGALTFVGGATANDMGWFTVSNSARVEFPYLSAVSNNAPWSLEFHCDMSSSESGAVMAIGGSNGIVPWVSAGKMFLYVSSQSIETVAGVVDGIAHHWAFVKTEDNVWKIYRDGVEVSLDDSTLTQVNNPSFQSTGYIGNDSGSAGSRAVIGRVGRILIWDFARYTGNFKPPLVTSEPLYETGEDYILGSRRDENNNERITEDGATRLTEDY